MTCESYEISFKVFTFLIKYDNMIIKGVKYENLYKQLGSLDEQKKTLVVSKAKETMNKENI